MAITNLGTNIRINKAKIPSSFAVPSVVGFTDWERQSKYLWLSVVKSTVHNADRAVTFTNLVAALEQQVTALVTDDYDAAKTVSIFTDFIDITSNYAEESGSGDWYVDGEVEYVCKIQYYVKSI
jgi:hypothetical protein